MAHQSQRDFLHTLKSSLPQFFADSKVLEIGSLDINGSIRDFYTNCDYVGIDIGEGKGVDVVCEGQKYNAPSNSFDQVISCEVMEHNPHWRQTLENMIRLCRPGGLVVMTCASTGRPEHGTTRTTIDDSPLTNAAGWDYYKNLTAEDFSSSINLSSSFEKYYLGVSWVGYDLCFFGIKRHPHHVDASSVEIAGRAIVTMESFIRQANRAPICIARQLFAMAFGDSGFEGARNIRTRITSAS